MPIQSLRHEASVNQRLMAVRGKYHVCKGNQHLRKSDTPGSGHRAAHPGDRCWSKRQLSWHVGKSIKPLRTLDFIETNVQTAAGFQVPKHTFSWGHISGHTWTLFGFDRIILHPVTEPPNNDYWRHLNAMSIGAAVPVPQCILRLSPSCLSCILKRRGTPKGYVWLFLRSRHLQSWKSDRLIKSTIREQEIGKRKEGCDTFLKP